jgi:3-hydroxybutyryl-CoA dehydratase
MESKKGTCMIGKTIKALKVGDTAQIQKTISETDVYLYAGITGDLNPAHVNEEYAKNTFFKTRIAHGMLTAGLISTVLGNKLPGAGSIYLHQSVNFLAPVHFGDTITAQAEVSEIDLKKNRVKLKTTCMNQEGTIVLDGEAIISPPKSA